MASKKKTKRETPSRYSENNLKIWIISISRAIVTIFFAIIIWITAVQLIKVIPLFADVLTNGVKNLNPEMALIVVTISLVVNVWVLDLLFRLFINVDNWFKEVME